MSASLSRNIVSTGFNLPFSGDQLLQSFDVINLKNGNEQITAEKLQGGGGATSLKAGGVALFNQGANAQAGIISFQGNGQHFSSIPATDAQQSVKIGAGGAVTVAPATTIAGNLLNLNSTQYLELAGVIAVGILLFVLIRRKNG